MALLAALTAAAIAIDNGEVRSQNIFTGRGMPYDAFDQLTATTLNVHGGALSVAFAQGSMELSHDRVFAWLRKSAEAVSTYYGKFPVPNVRILIVPVDGRGVRGGQTFGYRGPAIRLLVGTDCTEADLADDWKAVHEMVHLALPDVPDQHLWLAEGLAVYVESIARVQAGHLTPEKIWGDFVRDMPKGLPKTGDRGLDETHTWGRTYWGGAIYYLLADIELRKRSGNKIGLQQAMRGVVAAGGTHDQDWSIERILGVADKASGYPVMSELYEKMRATPYDPDLPHLWKEFGIETSGSVITLNDSAPLAAIRRAITAPPTSSSGLRYLAPARQL